MKRFKQYSSFFAFKAIRPFFTFAILLFSFSSLFGQLNECSCEPTGSEIFTIVGDQSAIPTLSSASSALNFPFDPNVPFPGGCIRVLGTFTIDLDWDVSNTDFFMQYGAEIIIEDVNVTITESNITGCLFDEIGLWRSITLSDPASSLRITDCNISDGEFAINLPVSGASIAIQNNIFNSNYVSIYSPPNSPGNNKQFNFIDNDSIIGNTFQSTYPLLPHYDFNTNLGTVPLAGVEMRHCALFKVGLQDDQSVNIFKDLRYGAIFRGTAGCMIGGADISDLVGESIGVEARNNEDQTQIRNCDMTNVRFGVNVVNSGSLVLQNTLDAINQGVRMFNCNDLVNVVLLNVITSNNTGIQGDIINNNTDNSNLLIQNNTITADRGIRLDLITNRATVENNTVDISATNSGAGITLTNSQGEIRLQNNILNFDNATSGHGFLINNSQYCQFVDNSILSVNGQIGNGFRVASSTDNLYCCNFIDGTARASNFIGICDNTKYRGTSYGINNTGLRLTDAMIGVQDHPGNNFAGGNLALDALFDGDPIFASLSKILTDDILMTNGLNNVEVTGGNASSWFDLSQGGDLTCPDAPTCGETLYSFTGNQTGEGYLLTPNDVEIAKFNNNPDWDGLLLKWEAQSNLYQKLKKAPNLISQDSDINKFFDNAKSGKLNDFYKVSDGIQTLFIPSNSQVTILSDLTNEINHLLSELESIAQELLIATGIDKTALEQVQIVKLSDLNVKVTSATDIRSQIKQEQFQQANYLLSINQYLEPEYVYQSNEKIINQIFLETIGHDIYEFTDHEQKIINSIANQCLTEGGKSVLRARALQEYYMTKFYDDDNGCGSNSNARIGDTKKQLISVYPNPNDGNFSIQFEYPTEENLEIEFYDLNGKLLFQDKLYRGAFNYSFQDKTLESGVYICKLRSEFGDVLTKKIVVNKF